MGDYERYYHEDKLSERILMGIGLVLTAAGVTATLYGVHAVKSEARAAAPAACETGQPTACEAAPAVTPGEGMAAYVLSCGVMSATVIGPGMMLMAGRDRRHRAARFHYEAECDIENMEIVDDEIFYYGDSLPEAPPEAI